jgi:hypothetical protein
LDEAELAVEFEVFGFFVKVFYEVLVPARCTLQRCVLLLVLSYHLVLLDRLHLYLLCRIRHHVFLLPDVVLGLVCIHLVYSHFCLRQFL